jgi:hypothetical protein
MSKGEELVETLIVTLNDIKNTYNYNFQNVNDLDKESQDLEHEIELSTFSSVAGYKLAKELQRVRRERRKLKNENETLQLLNEYFNDPRFKNLINDLCNIKGKIRKVQDNQANRLYTPKIRKDLTIPQRAVREVV